MKPTSNIKSLPKCLALAAAVGLSAVPFANASVLAAQSTQFLAGYDTESEILSVSGNTGEANELVSITLFAEGAINAEDISEQSGVIKLLRTDLNGDFVYEFKISEELKGNAYVLKAKGMHSGFEKTYSFTHMSKKEAEGIFGLLDESAEKNDFSGFKSTLSANSSALGISSEKINESSVYSKILYNNSPNGGYDISSFYTAQRYASAISDILDIKSDYATGLDSVITSYASELLVDTEEYKSISETQKTNFVKRIAEADEDALSNIKRENLYTEIMFLAKLDSAENYLEFKEIVLENKNKIKLDTEYYDKLSETRQNELFSEMYKSEYADAEAFKSDFKSKAEAAYNAQTSGGSANKPGGGGGGGGSTGGGTGLIINKPVDQTLQKNDTPEQGFSDTAEHWAKDYIEALVKTNVIKGYEDNTFKPENSITRAEFTKLVAESFEIEKSSEKIFKDVLENEWYFSYIAGAYKAEIIKGDGENFNPSGLITREDAAVILYNALKQSGGTVETGEPDFSDSGEIADYAKAAAGALQKMGIMTGNDGKFDPKSNTTRAEAATLLCRILKLEV